MGVRAFPTKARRKTPIKAGPPHPCLVRGPGEEAVSPVIGTILILAITVIGIAALMLWGGPTVDRVQAQNAQAAILGEFEGLLDASADLSVPDHSRFPSIAAPRGLLQLQEGTRIMVTVDHDADNPTCDLRVTGWESATPTATVTVSAPGCRPVTGTSFEVYEVSGTTLSERAINVAGATVTAPGVDFTEGDWLFRITDGAANPTVYAEAWLHSGDRLTWRLSSASGVRNVYLESGALFSDDGAATFLHRKPTITDTAFGEGQYGLWLRSYLATAYTGYDGAGTRQVFLALQSNDLHVDSPDAHRIRYSFAGPLAEAWCTTVLARDPLSGSPFDGVTEYAQDGSFPCAGPQALRSVTFRYLDDRAFQVWFQHARITITLVD
jgi:flagellin-like protein